MDALEEAVSVRRLPVLGICLGMQLMCHTSEEGHLPGLGWIDAEVRRLRLPADSNLKIPHMGWNTVRFAGVKAYDGEGIFKGILDNSYFYFVHSYHGVPADKTWAAGLTEYGGTIASAVQRDNVWATQFHPEKSAALGLKILENFCSRVGQAHYTVP